MDGLCACGCGRSTRLIQKDNGSSYYTKYHSKECYPQNKKKEKLIKICECGCQREFETGYTGRKYYGRSCEAKAYRARDKAKTYSDNPLCSCGCGQKVRKVEGHWNKYIVGHHIPLPETIEKARSMILGSNITEEANRKRSETMRQAIRDNSELKVGLVERLQKGRRVTNSKRLVKMGEAPLCKCGCGEKVGRSGARYRWNKYIKDHYRHHSEYIENMREQSVANFSNPEYIEKYQKGCNRKPNGFERLFESIKGDLFIKYVGDHSLWITLLDGKSKNPDFIIEGTNKVIELHGDYWHEGEDDRVLIDSYKEVGYDCLVIWEWEMKDIDKVTNRLKGFIKRV